MQVGLGALSASGAVPSLWVLGPLLFCLLCGFNALEASQPSLVSRMAPPQVRGAALAATTRCSRWACFCRRGAGGRAGEVVGPRGLVCRHHCAHGPVAGRVLEAAPRGGLARLAPGTENPARGRVTHTASGCCRACRQRAGCGTMAAFFHLAHGNFFKSGAFFTRYSYGIHQQSHHRR